MAVLAPRDWQQQQVYQSAMDANSTNTRQRSSSAADSAHQHPQQQPHHQPYPVQQPQGSWTPSISAAPFYPSFYQNHHQQQPYPAQSPYFDPANAQLAQWAYQQMLFNAQHAFPPQQRSNDYFTQNPAFNPFSSGTPPPHQNHRVRPSPLSQGTFTANERRMSRDDSDPVLDPPPNAGMSRSGGLKGRLRRALSFNTAQALKEEETSDDESIKASKPKAKSPAIISSVVGKSTGSATPSGSTDAIDDSASTATVQTKKKGRAASLFNAKMNISTDNISLSSTVSSASVMIRKLGSMGKLAKRNSLAGITSLFKDKDKKKKDKKGSAKAEASEASVSHVTAELDRSDWTVSADMNGLSPAAKLARQHTLKSNAEAAAKAKAAQEAAAAAASNPASNMNAASSPITANGVNGAGVPAWDKNTTTRQGSTSPVKKSSGGMRLNEDGTRVMVEDDDDESDDGHFNGPQQGGSNFHTDGWGEDDEDWDVEGDIDEDATIRFGLERMSMDGDEYDHEPWAIDIRRSVERTRTPSKGILKYAESYDQHKYLTDAPIQNRVRSNSYNSHPGHTPELGPLAHIPSPDPDQIDGLHKHPHSSHNTPPKKLVFDNNLSVYDTFPASVYDRRSEPATWSRLTPALAQRIKEELNSYKMEEMEVHAASRIHTQFFV
ncbi:Protein BNI4 [Termitomyces sp. J132]|nr:Protein BNI4 [Termitomyces sp. J132]